MAEEIKIKIKWPPTSGVATYVNNATMVVDSGGIVHLSFYQVIPPMLMTTNLDDAAEARKTLEAIGAEAHPVANMVMTLSEARKILKLLKQHLEESDEPSTKPPNI